MFYGISIDYVGFDFEMKVKILLEMGFKEILFVEYGMNCIFW